MNRFEKVAELEEIPNPGRKAFLLADEIPVVLLRVGDEYFCVEDLCTHDGQPLTDGPIAEGQIMCPRHGARFDLKTGDPTCMPATRPIRTFDIEVRGDGIYVAADI